MLALLVIWETLSLLLGLKGSLLHKEAKTNAGKEVIVSEEQAAQCGDIAVTEGQGA